MTGKKIVVEAPCKINLGLNILGIKNDYHLLDTVMMAVGLCDTIELKLRDNGKISTEFVEVNNDGLQIDPIKNSAYQAAKYVKNKFGVDYGADIRIIKRIPVAAGLGGSSCDAAGVLKAYTELLGLPISVEDAAEIGSDTAFLFAGAVAARCTGRGEILEPFEAKPLNLVIVVSGKVNTAECYKKFDEMYSNYEYSPGNIESLVESLKTGDVTAIGKTLGNALEKPAIKLEPQIAKTMKLVRATNPAAVFMSGSGASVVGLYKDKESADKARAELKGKCDFIW